MADPIIKSNKSYGSTVTGRTAPNPRTPFWAPVSTQEQIINGHTYPINTAIGYSEIQITNPYDICVLGNHTLPGIADIIVKVKVAHKKNPDLGTDGNAIIYLGRQPSEIDIILTIWTPQQLAILDDVLADKQIWGKRGTSNPAKTPASPKPPASTQAAQTINTLRTQLQSLVDTAPTASNNGIIPYQYLTVINNNPIVTSANDSTNTKSAISALKILTSQLNGLANGTTSQTIQAIIAARNNTITFIKNTTQVPGPAVSSKSSSTSEKPGPIVGIYHPKLQQIYIDSVMIIGIDGLEGAGPGPRKIKFTCIESYKSKSATQSKDEGTQSAITPGAYTDAVNTPTAPSQTQSNLGVLQK